MSCTIRILPCIAKYCVYGSFGSCWQTFTLVGIFLFVYHWGWWLLVVTMYYYCLACTKGKEVGNLPVDQCTGKDSYCFRHNTYMYNLYLRGEDVILCMGLPIHHCVSLLCTGEWLNCIIIILR